MGTEEEWFSRSAEEHEKYTTLSTDPKDRQSSEGIPLKPLFKRTKTGCDRNQANAQEVKPCLCAGRTDRGGVLALTNFMKFEIEIVEARFNGIALRLPF